MVVVQQEKVVKVPAHFLCRLKDGIDIKFGSVREGGEHLWHYAHLDFPGNYGFIGHPRSSVFLYPIKGSEQADPRPVLVPRFLSPLSKGASETYRLI